MINFTDNEITSDLKSRFFARFEQSHTDDCWIWKGSKNTQGYGQIYCANAKHRLLKAHRISLELKIGRRLNSKEFSCHTCDNPSCVNPKHLFVGTCKENTRDASAKGRLHKWGGKRKGSGNPKAKLNEYNVSEIKKMLSAGRGTKEISIIFGVSQTVICDIKSGRNWSHVL